MRFVVAGGGVAGLSASLAIARAGHEAVVLERDPVLPGGSPSDAFGDDRRGIPHYFQPHAFLPRGRRLLSESAPDVLDTLLEAGADPQDVALKLTGPRQPGDEDLVYLWVRRPVIEWALRRAAAAEPSVELRAGVRVTGLLRSEDARPRAVGVALDVDDPVRGDVVVDALSRYRCPPGWPRAAGEPTDSRAIYYCRYFELAEGVEHLDAPILNPRGDLGYMGFNTFRGDNRTFAVILLAPAADRELRVLHREETFTAACAAITPLDVMTSADYGRPITGIMPMGGLIERGPHRRPGRHRRDRRRRRPLPYGSRARVRRVVRARARPDPGGCHRRSTRRRGRGGALPGGRRARGAGAARSGLRHRHGSFGVVEGRAARRPPQRGLLPALLVHGRAGRGASRRPRPTADGPPDRPARPHGDLRRGRRAARADRGRPGPARPALPAGPPREELLRRVADAPPVGRAPA